MDEVQLAWLALSLAPGLGPRRILQAVDNVGSVRRILELSLTDLEALRFPATAVQFINGGQASREAEEEWKRVRAGPPIDMRAGFGRVFERASRDERPLVCERPR